MGVFTVVMVILVWRVWEERPECQTWVSCVLPVWEKVSGSVLAAIAATYILVEVGAGIMVLASWLKEVLITKPREERERAIEAEYEEADEQRLEGESIAEAVDRLRAVRLAEESRPRRRGRGGGGGRNVR